MAISNCFFDETTRITQTIKDSTKIYPTCWLIHSRQKNSGGNFFLTNYSRRTKTSFLPFLIAEDLIALRRSGGNVTKKSAKSLERSSSKKRKLQNVGDHLPIEDCTRRRCSRCTRLQKEVRTKTVCYFHYNSNNNRVLALLKCVLCSNLSLDASHISRFEK